MHPPYTAEKKYADMLAQQGCSTDMILRGLRSNFPTLGSYEAQTIAAQAYRFFMEAQS